MSSFTRFIGRASSILSSVLGAFGMGGDGCVFELSGAGETVAFPVSPASFEVTNPANNQTINVISIGDVNMLGNAGLASLKFDAFFPAEQYPFIKRFDLKEPYDYVQSIKAMQKSKEPCQISISGTDVSMPVTIEEFDYSEKDGSGDVYFSISLKEYRYVVPASDKTNDVTGMKGRIADTVKSKQTTCIGTMDVMDNAQKAVQRTTSIAKQCQRTLSLYRAMAKSGGVNAGVILKTTVNGVTGGGQQLAKW